MTAIHESIFGDKTQWTPRLIRRLRGKRTLAEFGLLVQAAANTVWRWEDGRSQPDEEHSLLLRALAEQERFLSNWRLGGSGKLMGNIDLALRRTSAELDQTVRRRVKALRD